MPEWTTPEDVRGRWTSAKPLNIDDEKLSLLLEDAEDLATREFSDIQTRIDGGSLPLNRVKRVIARVVIRHLRNPDGLRQAMDTTGPYTTQVMHGGDEPGEMYLSEEDRADLGESRTGRAFTIDTTPPVPPSGPDGWLAYGRTWYE